MVNPRRDGDYAKATGKLPKTDTYQESLPSGVKWTSFLDAFPAYALSFRSTFTTVCPNWAGLDRKKIAPLVGVAPLNCDCGKSRGKLFSRGDRADRVWKLHMGAVVAIRFNPVIKAFYKRLLAAGKKPKLAITACMRKLLTILNAMIENLTS